MSSVIQSCPVQNPLFNPDLNLVQCNPILSSTESIIQPRPAQWEEDNSRLDLMLCPETGNYFERIQFSPNSEGYRRRVHQAYSAGVCPLHCQTEPVISKKSSFPQKNVEDRSRARTSNPQLCVLLLVLLVLSTWVPLIVQGWCCASSWSLVTK